MAMYSIGYFSARRQDVHAVNVRNMNYAFLRARLLRCATRLVFCLFNDRFAADLDRRVIALGLAIQARVDPHSYR